MRSNENFDSEPRSLRQQQVLEEAAERPDASIDDLAAAVSSATPDLVERVLDEYGDPADSGGGSNGSSAASGQPDATATPGTDPAIESSDVTLADSPGGSDGGGQEGDADSEEADAVSGVADGAVSDGADGTVAVPAIEDLPERQRDLLAAVAAQPAATQETIADRFDVTSATVSRWGKAIPGFDWRDRAAFVDAVFTDPPASGLTTDGGPETEHSDGSAEASNGTPAGEPATAGHTVDQGEVIETDLHDLDARVAALEEADEDAVGEGDVFADPELVHKVLHACLQDDAIDESEELRLIEALLE